MDLCNLPHMDSSQESCHGNWRKWSMHVLMTPNPNISGCHVSRVHFRPLSYTSAINVNFSICNKDHLPVTNRTMLCLDQVVECQGWTWLATKLDVNELVSVIAETAGRDMTRWFRADVQQSPSIYLEVAFDIYKFDGWGLAGCQGGTSGALNQSVQRSGLLPSSPL